MATSQDPASIAAKTSASRLAEGVDKELTCAICLSRYETPKVLPCLHTYCKSCLENLSTKSRINNTVTCPQCKEEHQWPEDGVDGFRTYFTINNLLELLQVHETDGKGETSTQAIRCGSGLDENRAVAHCSNCCYYLCETCLNNHKVFTRGHNTVLLEEVKQSDKPTAAKSLQKVQYCKDHEDEVLKLFCRTCKKVICRDCALVKHRDHDYTFIREIRPEIQRQLEALIKKVQAKEGEYKSHIDYLEKMRGIGTSTLASHEREVNESFHRLQEAFESRRAALIAQLHDIHDSEKKEIDHEAEGLRLTLSKLSHSIGFTQQLLANGSDVEIISMGLQAVQTLESLKTVNWDKNSIKPTPMQMKFDTDFEKHLNKFGAICRETQPEEPLQLQPAQPQPAQPLPAELQPAQPQPAQPQPAHLQPAEVQPAELQPAQPQPAQPQPAQLLPAELQLADLQPAELQPAQLQPVQPQPAQPLPAELQPAQPQPAQPQPAQPQPAQPQPAQPQPAQPQPAQPQPAQLRPTQPQPAQPQPSQPQPAQPQPAETRSRTRSFVLVQRPQPPPILRSNSKRRSQKGHNQ